MVYGCDCYVAVYQMIIFYFLFLISSVSIVSSMDELGHHDENTRMVVTMENTYQTGETTATTSTLCLP